MNKQPASVVSSNGALSSEDILKLPAATLLTRLTTSAAGLIGVGAQSRLTRYRPN